MMISPRDAAFVGCRLLALYFFYSLIQSLPHAYSMLSSTIFVVRSSSELPVTGEVSVYGRIASHFVIDFAAMIFFWFGADRLSGRICPARIEAETQEKWDEQAVLSVAIVATGLVIVLSKATMLAQWTVVSLWGSELQYWTASMLMEVPGLFVSLFFGCLFIVSPGIIARLVSRCRRW